MTTLARRSIALAAAVSSALLLLAACAAEVPETPPAAPADDIAPVDEAPPSGVTSDGTVTVVTADQSFTFSPTTCMIGDEDILVAGPGVDDDSNDPAYLDIDFTTVDGLKNGEVRINLGTDAKFTTTDDFLTAFINPGEEYGLMFDADGDGVMVQADLRANGEVSIGPATVTVRCS